ncbi:hypothetical protein WI29_34070 [Burkholderia ubonensis]|nr:hypothetical protein WI31_15615 [Burkholderia ubonensis]KUZ07392.1 hypothetical protein WI29_34070 [Burkholderia ubonensis]KUZ20633.1 hypothetical protein WI30_01260 [Burkholderia ubonensis]KUZ33373.1 hypothetical protein WI32_19790 [Burkholderia ubonensis]KUZ44792.1 hypothetical protein WI33_28015 [Burkholderia ubonensis]
MLVRRILAAMLGTVTLALMVLAALILALAIPVLILRKTISTSILSSLPRPPDARPRMPNGSRPSRQK